MAVSLPSTITNRIKELCTSIYDKAEPAFIPVQTYPGAKPSECFSNVARKVESNGGSLQYGWCIWETKNVFIEAEFHAVWRSPEGDLICVSPHNENTQILFIEDPTKVFDGVHRIDNVRWSIRPEPVVVEYLNAYADYIRINDELTEGQFGRLIVTESPELQAAKKRLMFLEIAILRLPPLPKSNNFCICGSGKKYKRCCEWLAR